MNKISPRDQLLEETDVQSNETQPNHWRTETLTQIDNFVEVLKAKAYK